MKKLLVINPLEVRKIFNSFYVIVFFLFTTFIILNCNTKGGCEEGYNTHISITLIKSTATECIWETETLVFEECQVVGASLNGTGKKPSLSSITVENLTTGAKSSSRSPSGSDGSWSCLLSALNCSTLGCAGGKYRIIIKGDNCSETNPTYLSLSMG
jgi:hypothetical protein